METNGIMPRTLGTAMAGLSVLAALAGAATWRYDIQTGGDTFNRWEFPTHAQTRLPPDSTAKPGVVITYFGGVSGRDSVSWLIPRDGWRDKFCLGCPMDGWLRTIVTETYDLGNVRDTQQVVVGGVSRTYVRTSSLTSIRHVEKTVLVGIGAVWFRDHYSNPGNSSYIRGFRLLEYDGINIDTLWGGSLTRPAPVAVAPAKRPIEGRYTGRKFDLHEMGVFLGRKAVLDRAKPVPAGVK